MVFNEHRTNSRHKFSQLKVNKKKALKVTCNSKKEGHPSIQMYSRKNVVCAINY